MPLSGADTIVLGPAIDFFGAARRYIFGRTVITKYSTADVDYVLDLYSDACLAGQVDHELAITQMVHETAALTSDWSQPPRRNPAGIGVTGALGADGQPVGQMFDTWLEAVQCHVGLLLCYRYATNAEGTPSQQRLIRVCTSFRPSVPRGVAVTIAEMATKWAADQEYTNKLVAMSAAIAKA